MNDIAPEFRPPAAALALAAAAGLLMLMSVLFRQSPQAEIGLPLLATAALIGAGALIWRAMRRLHERVEALQGSEARQRAIIDGAGEAILVIDDQAIIQTFNRAAERMFGYSADEVIGTSLERLMTEGGRRAHAAYLAKHGVTAMVEAARMRVVHKGVRKHGEVFPFELTMTEWLDGERRVFTGVMRDVTDNERAADALRESHARFVGVFENSTQPLFIFALSGGGEFVLETMNEAAETWAGLSRFASNGQTPGEVAGSDARELKRALLDCLATAAPVGAAIRLAGQGSDFPLPMIFTPMRNASGEIRAVLASGQLGQTTDQSGMPVPARPAAAG